MKKIVFVSLLACGAVFADEPKAADKMPEKPPEAPAPAKELDNLKPFQKAWTCTGDEPGGAKYTSKFTVKKDLDGFWSSVRYERAKTKARGAFTGAGFIGLDPAAHNWSFIGFDTMGGKIDLHSAGPMGDSVTWEGDAIMGQKAPAKFSFVIDPVTKHLHFKAVIGGEAFIDEECK